MKRLLCRAGWLLATAFSSATIAAPAGSLDLSYGDGFGTQHVGYNLGATWDDKSEAMINGPAGTIYLIGQVALDGPKSGIGIARLLHDGKKDETFAPNGKKLYQEPSYSIVYVRDAALQADGKIVVAGSRIVEQPLSWEMMACRFDALGDIDATFGDPLTPGCRTIPSPQSNQGEANSVVIQADGRIVLAGYTWDANAMIDRAAAVRLLPDGTADASFGNQDLVPGYRILFPDFADDDTRLADIALTATGDLIAAGELDLGADGVDTDVLVARMKSLDGSLDETFDGSGYVYPWFDQGGQNNDRGLAIKALPDGSMVVAGSAQMAVDEFVPFALKLDNIGAGVAGFGDNGEQLLDTCVAAPCDMTPRDLQVTDSGKFLLAGAFVNEFSTDFYVLRLQENGERDSDFGPANGQQDGLSLIDIAGTADIAYRALPQGERVLVSGTTDVGGDLDFVVARLDHGIEETFIVTPSAEPGGTMTPNTDQEVAHSDQVDFVVTADNGFHISQVSGCGVTQIEGLYTSLAGVYTTAPVTADCTVTADFAPNFTVVYNAAPHGSITGINPQAIPKGYSTLPVQAVADEGYHFTQWSDGYLDSERQDENVTQNINVTALFEPNLYTVVPNPGPGGALSPGETVMVPYGGTTQFVVQPDPGFAIGEFSDCTGTLVGNVFTTNPILEGCKVNVTFIPSNSMFSLVYLTDGNGTLKGVAQQSVLAGANGSTVTAEPNPGYQFVTWSDGMTNPQRTDTHVVADIEVTAIFATEEEDVFFSVTPSVIGGGSISPNLVQVVASGDNAVFTLAADPGFVIQGVGGTCDGDLVGNTYTTLGVTANCTVIASFVTEQEAADAIFSDGFEDNP